MSRKLWFKQKEYGYGWVPSSWEGWLVIVVYVAVLVWITNSIDDISSSWLYLLLKVVVLTLTLLAICYTKGEKPAWRWGKTD